MAESKDPKGTCFLPKPNGDFCFSAFPAGFKISISKPTGGIFFLPITLSESYTNNGKEP